MELTAVNSADLQNFIDQRLFNDTEIEAFVFGRYDCNKSATAIQKAQSSIGLNPLPSQKQQNTANLKSFSKNLKLMKIFLIFRLSNFFAFSKTFFKKTFNRG